MTEDKIEQNTLEILRDLGWLVLRGPEIGPDGAGERQYRDVMLAKRLEEAVHRLNPDVPANARDEAIRKVIRSSEPSLLLDNHQFHRLLVNGVDIEYRHADGNVRTGKVRLFDFDDPARNEFVAVNQLTVMQGDYHRRPDVVLYVNGLPLAVIELKDPTNAKATIKSAFQQLQTYKESFPIQQ